VHLRSMQELAPTDVRVVVINVGTPLTAAVAVASAIEHLKVPVLVIDCDPSERDAALLSSLMGVIDFDLIRARTQLHGELLDGMFSQLACDIVVLLDSDAEIRNGQFARRCLTFFELPRVFGAGFVKGGPIWMKESMGATPRTGLGMEAPWTPFLALRRSHVLAALDAGATFRAHTVYNDVRFSARLSRLLATRFQNEWSPPSRLVGRLPLPIRQRLRRTSLPKLRWARREVYGQRPNYMHYDTAAEIFEWCKYQAHLIFAGAHRRCHDGEIAHHGGLTRRALNQGTSGAAPADELEGEARRRLRSVYGIDWRALEQQADGTAG
jgi:hypothetical protein